MDMLEPQEQQDAVLGRRARRAVPLIAAALAVAVVTGLLYLRPAAPHLAGVASPSPSAPTLEPTFVPAYDFVTPELGWAVLQRPTEASGELEDFWIFRTQDGARHWTLQQHGSSISPWPGITMTFFDRSHGVIALGGSFAERTSDGGGHWNFVALPQVIGTQITFADPMHGWFAGVQLVEGKAGTEQLYRTADGGGTWERLPDPPATNLTFRNAGEGWGAVQDGKGGAGTVYATWDGGLTWDRVPLTPAGPPPDYPTYLETFVRLIPKAGVVVGVGGLGFVSFDHGTTWKQLAALPSRSFADVAFQDATHWWTMPFGNLYRSSDAGASWHHVVLRLDNWNYGVGVVDARHAWALLDTVGTTGPFVRGTALALTSDGGANWSYANVPNPG